MLFSMNISLRRFLTGLLDLPGLRVVHATKNANLCAVYGLHNHVSTACRPSLPIVDGLLTVGALSLVAAFLSSTQRQHLLGRIDLGDSADYGAKKVQLIWSTKVITF